MKPNIITKKLFSFHGIPLNAFVDEKGGLWFDVYDACNGLGLDWRNDVRKRPYVKKHTEKRHRLEFVKEGQRQRRTIIHESLFYKLTGASHKEAAEEFCEWVFSEVIPTIRKHGMYIEPSLLEDYETLKENFLRLQNEYKGISSENKNLKNRIEYLDEKVKTVDSVCISQIANKLGLSAKKANQALEELGVIQHFIKGWNCTLIGRQYGFDCVGSDGNFYVRYKIESASKIYAILKEYLEEQEG